MTGFRSGNICDVCGNLTVWSFSVGQVAKGAAEQLSDLGTAVNNVGPGKSIANKVKDAQTALAISDVPGTSSILSGFVSEVKAQSGKKIPANHGGHVDRQRGSKQDSARLLKRFSSEASIQWRIRSGGSSTALSGHPKSGDR